jgi:hypothetical protein
MAWRGRGRTGRWRARRCRLPVCAGGRGDLELVGGQVPPALSEPPHNWAELGGWGVSVTRSESFRGAASAKARAAARCRGRPQRCACWRVVGSLDGALFGAAVMVGLRVRSHPRVGLDTFAVSYSSRYGAGCVKCASGHRGPQAIPVRPGSPDVFQCACEGQAVGGVPTNVPRA